MLPFVRKHASVVMADLRREYGVDLLDLWRGQLSFYELMVYLSGLPQESRTVRLMRDLPEEAEGWGLTEMLIAGLIDTVRGLVAEEGKPPESVIPKALMSEPAEQPDLTAQALFGKGFVTQHGR